MEQSLRKEEVILLTTHSYNWKPTVLQVFTGLLGALLLISSISSIVNNDYKFFGTTIHMIEGLLFLFFAFFVYDKRSPVAPKIVVNEQYLIAKTSVFSKKQQYAWNDINEIELGLYSLHITLKNSSASIKYEASAENSKAAKDAVREVAEIKGITVIAG